MSRLSLSGQVALVSGAASGIGAATAEALARAGAKVALADIDRPALSHQVDRMSSEFEVVGTAMNVAIAADCERAVAETIAAYGRLDILVNSAGVGSFDSTLDSTTEEEWDRVMGINLKGVFLLSRSAVPEIRRNRGGCIVNVASVHALATSSGVLAHAASKGGVLALTRAMAIDLANDHIRAVAILPGATDTSMLRRHVESQGKSYEEMGFATEPGAIGRVGDPAEVAQVIAFLVSPSASLVNGAAIVVDGGLLAAF